MGNCNTCKYHKTTIHIPFGGVIFLRQFKRTYCSFQNCSIITNPNLECIYYKQNFWDKLLQPKFKDIKYSDNVKRV